MTIQSVAMLKNQWYAVEFVHLVGDTPHKVQIMGQDLVLYRTSRGDLVAHNDLCVHRGGALSGGSVHGDCIRCPYHGWEFGPDGACSKIPSNAPSVPIPKKARTDSYPVVERYGFVFVFLGDAPEHERPPVPPIETLEPTAKAQAEGYAVVHGEFTWNANFERVIENAVDIAHTPFVHAGSFGNPDKPEIEDFELVELRDYAGRLIGAQTTVLLDPPPASGMWKYLRKGKERPLVKTKTGLYFPNVSLLEVNLPLGQLKIFTAAVPIDEYTTVSKWTMLRTFFTGKWADKNSYGRTMKIFYEDQATVEGQRPELVPFDLSAELHVKSDSLQLAYRRWRGAQYDAGNGIEPHRIVTADDMRTRTVIPSPARRANPELANAWVLKEVASRMIESDRAKTRVGEQS